MVEGFIPSSDFVILANHVIIHDNPLRLFPHHIPCNSSILKQFLPNDLMCLPHSPSSIIESEVIPFHPNGPQGNAPLYQPHSSIFAKRDGDYYFFLSKDTMLAFMVPFDMVLLSWCKWSSREIPRPSSKLAIPKYVFWGCQSCTCDICVHVCYEFCSMSWLQPLYAELTKWRLASSYFTLYPIHFPILV